VARHEYIDQRSGRSKHRRYIKRRVVPDQTSVYHPSSLHILVNESCNDALMDWIGWLVAEVCFALATANTGVSDALMSAYHPSLHTACSMHASVLRWHPCHEGVFLDRTCIRWEARRQQKLRGSHWLYATTARSLDFLLLLLLLNADSVQERQSDVIYRQSLLDDFQCANWCTTHTHTPECLKLATSILAF